MADFHFEVDTTPMAQSVSTVQGHVAGVAAAVTAMEAAVIATEREAAQRICDNADLGFMILIRSQVSQKLVAAQSEMNSRLMTLVELSKAIDTVMRQMESDYNMIKRRYTKLFRALDRALETRVRELDRPAMQLNEIKRNIIFDKLKDESSLLLDSSNEVITLEQTALAGKLKQKTRDTVRTLSDSIQNSRAYNETVYRILNPAGAKGSARYLPALFAVTESLLNASDSIESVYTPPCAGEQSLSAALSGALHTLLWKAAEARDRDAVRGEFVSLCERERVDERVAREMLRLYDESEWEEARP